MIPFLDNLKSRLYELLKSWTMIVKERNLALIDCDYK